MTQDTRASAIKFGCVCFALLIPLAPSADEATIAVAANFTRPMQAVAEAFESGTRHHLKLVFGSTGQLYAQITNGAPFDVYLAADQQRPERLVADGLADGSTQLTYAIGELVLWTRRTDLPTNSNLQILQSDRYRHLAIANPDLAPYGAAAREVLMGLDLWPAIDRRIAFAQSIGQAFAMVATGNAEFGFVASSQISIRNQGTIIAVPRELYTPIRQDAVLLKRGLDNEAALGLIEFLSTTRAQTIIKNAGYTTVRISDLQ